MQEVNKAAGMLDLMMDEIGQTLVVDGAVEAFLGQLSQTGTTQFTCDWMAFVRERFRCDHVI